MIRSRQGKLGLVAVAAVALTAAGAAFAASRMHGSAPSTRAGFGPGPAGMAPGYGFPGGRFGDHRGFDGAGPFGALQAAADYLGLSQSALFDQLRSGKTLAQIASSTSGKSTSGLVDAMVKREQSRLAQAVEEGRLTQAQADRVGADLTDRITAMVNGSFAGPPRFGDQDGDGDRGGGGMPTPPSTPPTHI